MARQPFNPNLIKTPEKKSAHTAGQRLSVSQVTSLVKEAIESELPATLHVVGEISNFKRHSSGHLYLTLKDRNSELACVMWRSGATKLKFEPDDGMEVVATGSVEVFERAGRYQLYIRKLEPVGVGALELAFRRLCEKLTGEGLFDESHKRSLPAHPRSIALVTSPTGAAIGDMLRTIERRYPCVRVLVYPVRVQGPGAAEEIADAIKSINANNETLGGIDVMIVGRGGGSLEDLWAFNEEIVARAIHASGIPIISAVGHEIDVTIADMIADVRAATPTAAAELAVPVLEDLLDELASQRQRLSRSLRSMLELANARWSAVSHRGVFRKPFDVVRGREQFIDELAHRTHRRVTARAHALRQRLDYLESIVQRIAPHTLLRSRTAKLHDDEKRLRGAISARLVGAERATHALAYCLERAAPAHVVPRKMDDLKHLHEKLIQSIRHQLAFETERLRRQSQRLSAMSYESVLGRGYSITRIAKGRKIVRSLEQIRDRQKIVTEVAGGAFESEVINLNQLELFE
jgi:exodeoxyribonuclease VII large subunit